MRKEFDFEIKEKTLKECGYCCAICGQIPVEFAHIDTNNKNNKYENCLVLCPTCHDKREENYPVEYLINIKNKIISNQYSFPVMTDEDFYYFNPQEEMSFVFRNISNKVGTSFNKNKVNCIFSIGDKEYFVIEKNTDKLVFSIDIEDADGKVLAKILKNVIEVINKDELIIHPAKKILKIYNKDKEINLEIRKNNTANGLIFDIETMFLNRLALNVEEGYVNIGTNRYGNCSHNQAYALISINSNKPGIIQII